MLVREGTREGKNVCISEVNTYPQTESDLRGGIPITNVKAFCCNTKPHP